MQDLIFFIDKLPDLMLYLVQGFVFIAIFDFITYSTKTSDIKHLFIKSVVGSFILKILFDVINACGAKLLGGYITNNSYIYIISIIVFSALIAYILSRAVSAKWFNEMLPKLKISRNAYRNIWLDIVDGDYAVWLTVVDEKKNLSYRGVIDKVEESAREPIVVLARYQVIDENGDIIEDNNMESRMKMVLNMSEYKMFELYYNIKSQNIKSVVSSVNKDIAQQKNFSKGTS